MKDQNKPAYRVPKIIRLDDSESVVGGVQETDCRTGTNATTDCASGAGATGWCDPTGANAALACEQGDQGDVFVP
jgi:hypothetical protein